MNSTRRQFVAVTLAAMPALSTASAATRTQKSNPGNNDPVWAQIQQELNRLQEEVKNKKPTAQTIRAFESTLRFHAAHASSKGRDQQLAQAVKDQIRAKGRAAFLADAIDVHRQHERHAQARVDSLNRPLPPRQEPTAEELGLVADRLARGGYAAMLRECADANRRLGDSLPVDVLQGWRLVARGGIVEGYCSDFSQVIAGIKWLRDLICMLAAFDPPMFLSECIALEAEVLILEMVEWWFCTVI